MIDDIINAYSNVHIVVYKCLYHNTLMVENHAALYLYYYIIFIYISHIYYILYYLNYLIIIIIYYTVTIVHDETHIQNTLN